MRLGVPVDRKHFLVGRLVSGFLRIKVNGIVRGVEEGKLLVEITSVDNVAVGQEAAFQWTNENGVVQFDIRKIERTIKPGNHKRKKQ